MELREELVDLFDRGVLSRHPVQEYEQAMARGDRERANVIGEIGPRFLAGQPFAKKRLAELVEANQPVAAKRAQENIAKLEAEGRQADTARAIYQRLDAQRAARPGGVRDAAGDAESRSSVT